jgi:hypothetical protein
LEEQDIEQAINACMTFSTNVTKMTMGAGKSMLAPQTAQVIEILMNQPKLTIARKTLLRKMWGDADHFDLDRIIQTLEQAGILDIHHRNNETVYDLKPEFVAKYVEFKRKKAAP